MTVSVTNPREGKVAINYENIIFQIINISAVRGLFIQKFHNTKLSDLQQVHCSFIAHQ